MPVIWQSSQQPMYVRTVWVDGFRHAILTEDDPYFKKTNSRKKRPHSSTSSSKPRTQHSRLSHRGGNLEECLRKLSFVITNHKKQPNSGSSVFEDEIEKLDLENIDQQTDEEFLVRSKALPLNEFDSGRSKFNSLCLDMKTIKSNRTARTDVKENTDLSERVLQWLDLAGKIDLLAPDNETTRLSQPRHSWPEIQKRNTLTKSKTVADLKTKNDPSKENPQSRQQDIDRPEFHVPVPSNTIEHYARQSRHIKISARNDATAKNAKTKTRELSTNVHETRQKVVSERHAVERQYAELVSKKILPDYKSKKQVHIFMPAVPKKATTTSNLTSVTESLLSQLS